MCELVCQVCCPHPIRGVNPEILRLLDLLRVAVRDPCCSPPRDRLPADLAGSSNFASWPIDNVGEEVSRLVPDRPEIALNVLTAIREWHRLNPGDVAAMAATRLVWPPSLLRPGWGHGGGVRRSDGHVHHGGLFSFEDILNFRREPRTRNDVAGRRQVGLWNAIIRVLQRPGDVPIVESDLRQFMHEEGRSSADAFLRLRQHVRSYRDELPHALEELIAYPAAPPAARDFAVRTAASLYGCVKIPLHGGFGEFFRVFDQVEPAKIAGPSRYKNALARQVRGAGVARLELRKNGGAREVLRQVCESRAPLLDSAIVAVPTGITRVRRRATSCRGHALGGRPGSMSIRLPSTDWAPDTRNWQFFHGFDINGPEVDSYPSWIFAVVFERLRVAAERAGLPPPAFAMHAGEAWMSPLDGLRRIGEVLLFPEQVRPRRIGHGLALDQVVTGCCASCWENCVRDSHVTDLLFNWLWLVHCGHVGSKEPPEWGLMAESSVKELVPRYASLFDPGFYRLRGWLAPSASDICLEWPELLGMDVRRVGTTLGDETIRWYANAMSCLLPGVQERVRSEVARLGLVVECCPTSNVWIGRVKWYDQHPALRLAHAGIKVTLNTDNPGFLETSVADEEELMLCCLPDPAREIEEMIASSRDVGMRLTAEHVEGDVDWHSLGASLNRAASARDGGWTIPSVASDSLRSTGV
jgi:hypothetical protein